MQHKTNDEITQALTQFRQVLDKHQVNVEHSVISDILDRIIFDKVDTQLSQAVSDWDLNSLMRLKDIVNTPPELPMLAPKQDTKARPKAKKIVQ